MAVSIANMRELLLPGLYAEAHWEALFASTENAIMSDISALSIPVSVPAAVAIGAAAAIIKNPPVTRRILSWLTRGP